MLRFGFWPATPEKPVVAFHLDFMELVTVLQIESQLSVKSLCDALQYMRHFRIDDVKEVSMYFFKFIIECLRNSIDIGPAPKTLTGDELEFYSKHRQTLSGDGKKAVLFYLFIYFYLA